MFSDAFDGCQHNGYARMPRCDICVESSRKWDKEHPRDPIDLEEALKFFRTAGEAFAKTLDKDMLKVFMEYDENKDADSNREGNNDI